MASALDRISAALGLLGKRKEPDVNNAELSRAEQGPSKRIVFRPWDQKDMHRRRFRWLNEFRDQLCCEFCSVRLRYPQHPPASTTAHDARQRASVMFAEQLVSKHDAGCPWRSTCCDDGVLACSNGTTDLTPGALQSGFATRTAQLLRVDRLPDLHPRTAAALVSTAASLFRPASSTGPGPDPLAQQDAADTAAAALRRALGVRLPASSSKTAGVGEAGGDKGADLAAVPAVLPAAPTHSQKAKLLALLGWECQELVGESSSLRGGHPAGKQGSQGPPIAFHPSACVYGLAHLGIASGSGKSRHGKGQADCRQGGVAAGEKAAPSRLSMANVVLSCPLCKSRVGLWNCIPGASASSLPAKQPPSTLDPPPPSPGHAAGSQTLTHPAQPALAPVSALPCPSPKVSLFSTIAGGSYQAPARASMATVPGWSSPRTPQAAGRPSAASIPSTALHSPTSQPLAPAMQTALTPVFGVGGLASKPPVFGLNSFPAASASAAAAMTAGLSSPLRARGGAASPARCQAEAAGRGEQAPSRLSGPVSGSSAADGLSLNGGRGGVDAFDSLGQHRSWCPWVFTGSNTGAAASPAKLVKCGWLYLLEALEADLLEAKPCDVHSMAGNPRANGDDSIANGSECSIAATKDSIIATLRRILGNKTFRHTSNGRNELMFKEATEFAQSIRLLEKDLRAVLKCIDGQYKNLRGILVSPVPNIYEEGEHGPVSTQPGVRLLGANMDVEAIPQAAEAARQRITREVFEPLQEWLKAYNRAEDHMRRLEAVRLELDSRRRTVTNLEGRLTRIRADLGSTKHKGLIEMKEVEETLARKEEKMSSECLTAYQHADVGTSYVAEEAFRTQELLVYHSLVIIVKDTAVLRDYTYSSLLIIQECFGAAAAAYDAKPAPQGSTNYAQLAYHPPAPVPGNKYEAQFTGAERSTPKGLIGSMFERIRKGKVPDSPVGSHPRSDANDTHDQASHGCKVVFMAKGTDQRRGRGLLIKRLRTSSVSSAVNKPQPCGEQVDYEQTSVTGVLGVAAVGILAGGAMVVGQPAAPVQWGMLEPLLARSLGLSLQAWALTTHQALALGVAVFQFMLTAAGPLISLGDRNRPPATHTPATFPAAAAAAPPSSKPPSPSHPSDGSAGSHGGAYSAGGCPPPAPTAAQSPPSLTSSRADVGGRGGASPTAAKPAAATPASRSLTPLPSSATRSMTPPTHQQQQAGAPAAAAATPARADKSPFSLRVAMGGFTAPAHLDAAKLQSVSPSLYSPRPLTTTPSQDPLVPLAQSQSLIGQLATQPPLAIPPTLPAAAASAPASVLAASSQGPPLQSLLQPARTYRDGSMLYTKEQLQHADRVQLPQPPTPASQPQQQQTQQEATPATTHDAPTTATQPVIPGLRGSGSSRGLAPGTSIAPEPVPQSTANVSSGAGLTPPGARPGRAGAGRAMPGSDLVGSGEVVAGQATPTTTQEDVVGRGRGRARAAAVPPAPEAMEVRLGGLQVEGAGALGQRQAGALVPAGSSHGSSAGERVQVAARGGVQALLQAIGRSAAMQALLHVLPASLRRKVGNLSQQELPEQEQQQQQQQAPAQDTPLVLALRGW
ncbi:hypothetical protein QJQ45_018390 [Haematococcus lacustris]|nr:hypothetical protein QJQ45_018390 [Haematococcus lacustris]